jgi:hypothetical protein
MHAAQLVMTALLMRCVLLVLSVGCCWSVLVVLQATVPWGWCIAFSSVWQADARLSNRLRIDTQWHSWFLPLLLLY